MREQRPLLAWFLWLAALSLIVDQTSKWAALTWLEDSPVTLVAGWLRLALVRNERSAWGLLPGNLWLIASGIVLCAAILIATRRVLGRDRQATSALALLVAGAAGNVVDRVRLGVVIDFIDVRLGRVLDWPVFNLADVAMVSGVILLAVYLVARGR